MEARALSDGKDDTPLGKVVPGTCFNINKTKISKNSSRNKLTSFKLPVTLWVFGTMARAEALVDSEATSNFINKLFVKKHNLVMNKMAIRMK
jgi:hypothetical protein